MRIAHRITIIAVFTAMFCISAAAGAAQIRPEKSAIGQISAQLGIPFPHSLRESLWKLRQPVMSELPALSPLSEQPAESIPLLADFVPTEADPFSLPGMLPDTLDLPAEEAVAVKEAAAPVETHVVAEKKPRVVPLTAMRTPLPVKLAKKPEVVPHEATPATHEARPGKPAVMPASMLSVAPRESLPATEIPQEPAYELPAAMPVSEPASVPVMAEAAPVEIPNEIPAEIPFETYPAEPVAEVYVAETIVAEPELLPLPASVPAMPMPMPMPTPREETSVADTLPPPALVTEPLVTEPLETALVTEIRGTGTPGPSAMEGTQAPRLSVEKTAPPEIQVGKPSTWSITVKNEGGMEARGVQIHDVIPRGAKFISSNPRAARGETGDLTWNVGNMPPGTMAVVKVELVPVEEGTIGSVASVTFRSEASAKSVATRPQLTLQTTGQQRVLVGDATELVITVSNPGSGVTRNVVLAETVPPELQFDGGAELIYQLGDLQPGETKQVALPLTAVRAGGLTNTIVATADANLRAESTFAMEVTAPALAVSMEGPSKRFLEREGTYKVTVTNPGTAPAKDVEMKVALPAGVQFVQANNGGGFLADSRNVCWRLAELPVGDSATAEMTVALTETGTLALKYEAVADICPVKRGEKAIQVEGIAALMFQVSDSNDPVQVGEETTYEVNVMNQGSKQAEDVCVVVRVPAGMQVVECKAPAQHTVQGNEIHFAALPQLAPKAEMIYQLRMRGLAVGDQRISVGVSSREFVTPIVKEESTRVYAE